MKLNKQIKLLNLLRLKYIVLLGTPKHSNIGDRAIAYAEEEFIRKKHRFMPIIEIPYGTDTNIMSNIGSKAIVLLHGGGNFGDVWKHEEDYRINAIDVLKNNKIVIFPQTMFFKDAVNLKRSFKHYSAHPNLSIILREEKSFNGASRNFKNNKILLSPDIVMSLSDTKSKKGKREGLLVVMRNDKEKVINSEFEDIIKDIINDKFKENVIYSDMHTDMSDDMLKNTSHRRIVEDKLNQFRQAELVITDRLHGMIFSLITGTPCIVMESSTHKTTGVYKWIKKAGYDKFIKLCKNPDDIKNSYMDLDLNLKKHFSYSAESFSEEWKNINELIFSEDK